jgi:type I restriction enzyme, S subunit
MTTARRPISSFTDVVSGGTPLRDRREYFLGHIPWVKTLDLNGDHVISTEEKITEAALLSIGGEVNPIGSVMVAMYGGAGTIGKSGVLAIPAATNQAVASILPNPTVFDSDFLHFQLLHLRPLWMRFSQGNRKDPNINKGIVERMEVWLPGLNEQRRVAARLRVKLDLVRNARVALQNQFRDLVQYSSSIVAETLKTGPRHKRALGEAVTEVTEGIGREWKKYPVLGATRSGLAPAREKPGKHGERYKVVTPGAVFYNPMRILIGSIAFVEDDDQSGITSPDYVVLAGRQGVVDSRWFYYWLRSPTGQRCILSLARGAVRERMLFNRLAEGEIELPDYGTQVKASKALAQIKPMRVAIQTQTAELGLLPHKLLAQIFES